MATSLKFKYLSVCNASLVLVSFIIPGVIGYVGAKYLQGPFNKNNAANKAFWPTVIAIYYLDVSRRFNKEIPRRLYTEILTEDN